MSKNCVTHHFACDCREQKFAELEAENAALKQRIIDDNKAYGCEIRDPSGTIWEHAQKLQKENAALKQTLDAQMQHQRELQADRDRLDWLMTQKHIRYPFAPHDDGKVLRQRIDAAMGEGKL